MPNSGRDEVHGAPPDPMSAAERRRATLLDTSDNLLAKGVAPAMPWLFLTLRRSLIPTVCLLVLGVLFFAVPQTSEVLLGLTEPVTEHVTGPQSGSSLNVAPLTWYLIWSVFLSLAVWYSARLLCTVEAWLGMPVVWEIRDLGPHWPSDEAHTDPKKRATEDRVKIAIERLPRVYGVGVLVATMGALVFATLFSLSRGKALTLVALLLSGPLIFACGALRWPNARWRWRSGSVIALAAGGGMYMGAAIVLGLRFVPEAHQSVGAVVTVDLLCALLPALVLTILVLRRPVMKRIYRVWFKRSDKLFTYEVFESHHALRFEDVFWQVFSFVAIGAALLILLANLQTNYLRSIGSVGTIMLFLAAAVNSITGCQLFLRRISRAVPGFTSAVAIVVFVVLQFFAHEPLGNETIGTRADTDAAPDRTPPGPSQAVPSSSTAPTPRVLVNAYGGGLRAAIYTAQVLALADDASCGEFGRHLYALSGVSGGSLGIAVYLIARQTLAPALWQGCTKPADKPFTPISTAPASSQHFPTPLTDVVTNALVQDHLSPVIATALSIDLFLRTPLTPNAHARRGQAMLDSWNDALDQSFKLYGASKQGPMGDFPLALPIGDLNGAIAPAPVVFFNTTDADSGEIEWFSNGAHGRDQSSFKQPDKHVQITVGQAVLHSARFPLVTPAGAYQENDTPHRLVDGGYADNSGARTLLARVLATVLHDYPRPNDVVLLDINGNPPDQGIASSSSTCRKAANRAESSIPTGMLALLQSRAARADDAVDELANALPSCTQRADTTATCLKPIQLAPEPNDATLSPRDLDCEQIENARTAPLGWYTGPGASQLVSHAAKAKVQEVCQLAGTSCNPLP